MHLTTFDKIKILADLRIQAELINGHFFGQWFNIHQVGMRMGLEVNKVRLTLADLHRAHFLTIGERQKTPIFKIVLQDSERLKLIEQDIFDRTKLHNAKIAFLNELLQTINIPTDDTQKI